MDTYKRIADVLRKDNKRLRDALSALKDAIPDATAQQKPLMLSLIETALAPTPVPPELISVDELDISTRLSNCLYNADLHTVGDIIAKSECDMRHYRNFGNRSLVELRAVLASMGLSLAKPERAK